MAINTVEFVGRRRGDSTAVRTLLRVYVSGQFLNRQRADPDQPAPRSTVDHAATRENHADAGRPLLNDHVWHYHRAGLPGTSGKQAYDRRQKRAGNRIEWQRAGCNGTLTDHDDFGVGPLVMASAKESDRTSKSRGLDCRQPLT